MKNEKIKLGQEVEDVITGFKGIAITKNIFVYQAVCFEVKPKVDKDGKMCDYSTIDEDRLKVINEEQVMKPIPCDDLGIKLHDKVKEPISGVSGIVQALAYHITGCVQVAIAPKGLDRDHKLHRSTWFPAGQVEVVKQAKQDNQPKPFANVGGPIPSVASSTECSKKRG